MAYYSRDGNKLDLKNMEFLNKGKCASVFSNSNFIFKKYFSSTDDGMRISSSSFDVLKGVCDSHFVELYDCYGEQSLFNSFKIDAYTAKYYDDDSINILLENKDYVLDNFRELESLFDRFSNDNIFVNDMSRKNSILGKDGIVIIDPDLFIVNLNLRDYFSDNICELFKRRFSLFIENKKELLMLFIDLLLNALKDIGYDITNDNFSSLYDFRINKNTEVVNEISKRLRYVKKPIDAVRKYVN